MRLRPEPAGLLSVRPLAVLPEPTGAGLFDWHWRFSAILLFWITSPPLFWLAWKYFLFVRRRREPILADLDLIALHDHGVAFDRLVADVMAGRVRLPAEATEEGATRLVRADPSAGDGRRMPNARGQA